MAESFDGLTANLGTGGAVFAADEFTDASAATRRMPFSCITIPDGTGYVRVGDSNGLPIQMAIGETLATNYSYSDDDDWTDGTSKHALVGGLYQSTPQTITDGDVGPIQVTQNGYVIVSAIQNGTWNVGTVTTVTTVSTVTNVATIGTSVTPGTSAAHLGKAVDAAAGASDTGVALLAVRDDALATLTPVDGDYTHLRVTSTGALWTSLTGTATVSNVGTFAVQVDGAALTALQLIDDPVFADDAAFTLASSKVMMVGAIRDDSLSTLTAIEGDAVPFRVDSTGALHVTGGGGGTEYTEDVATANPIVGTATMMERDDALSALTPIEGDWAAMRCNANGALWTAIDAGTITTVSTVTTCSTVTTVSTLTGGGVAHDGADSGNPHKIGAKAEAALSGVTLVADADRTDLYAGLDGALFVRPHCALDDVVSERDTNTDGNSTAFNSGLAAPGAGIRLCITSVTIANSSSAFCTVDLRDGSAGAVLWTIPVPATGGAIQPFDPPLKLTANTALAYDASAATTTLTISANGFKTKL